MQSDDRASLQSRHIDRTGPTFSSVLESLLTEEPEAAPIHSPRVAAELARQSRSNSGCRADAIRSYAEQYLEVSEPQSSGSVEDEIRTELGLEAGLTRRDLARRRRAFAQRYHPDLYDKGLRAALTARLALANQIIDEAMRTAK